MAQDAKQEFQYLLDATAQYRQLARPLPAQRAVETWWPALMLQIGDCPLICRQAFINEVMSMPKYAALPSANPWVLGVANMRGELLPLVDVAAFLGMAVEPSHSRRVLVCHHHEQWLGLVVDAVYGMQRLKDEQLEPEPACPSEPCRPFALQSAMVRRRRHWLLDIDRLLSDEKFLEVGRQPQAPTIRQKQG
ncbi:MAG TPA: chemotaxis protein CheW [Pseudomonadales bacterium]|nr:chemotaxis protein CheW [Pseudomonadales bacterium]